MRDEPITRVWVSENYLYYKYRITPSMWRQWLDRIGKYNTRLLQRKPKKTEEETWNN